MSYIEKNPGSSTHKTTYLPSQKTIQVRRTKTCGTLLEKQGQTHKWRSSMNFYTRTDLRQLGVDTGYSLEDLPGAMDDRDEWSERERERERERESQGNPCWHRYLMMMMMMIKNNICFCVSLLSSHYFQVCIVQIFTLMIYTPLKFNSEVLQFWFRDN